MVRVGWCIRNVLSFDLLAPLAICALSVLLLAPIMLQVHTAEYDEAIFLDVARNIQRFGLPLRSLGANGTFFMDHTPLYLYLLSLYAKHSETGILFARAVTVLPALAVIALTYRFGVRIGGRLTGVIAALLLAINPFFLVYAFFIRMEMFMLLTLLTGLFLTGVGVEEERDERPLLAGIMYAVAVLFKEFALIGVVVGAMYVFWQRRRAPQRAVVGVLFVALPSLLAVVGWAAWSWKLSSTTFAATINRWLASAVSPVAMEPRMGLTWTAWAAQLGSQLLGPGLVLGLVLGLGQLLLRRGRIAQSSALLWAYALAAIGLSFATSLKEPRHLIAVLPAAALIAGHALASLWHGRRGAPGALDRRAAAAVALRVQSVVAVGAFVVVFAFAGPVRPPLLPRPAADTRRWVAPAYAERLANEDFYRVLARTGIAVQQLSDPDELIVVAHQGPVVAYYADRHYLMLYTLTEPAIMRALAQARLLVWDSPTWLALPAERESSVEARVAAEFDLLQQVDDTPPIINIYKRRP